MSGIIFFILGAAAGFFAGVYICKAKEKKNGEKLYDKYRKTTGLYEGVRRK